MKRLNYLRRHLNLLHVLVIVSGCVFCRLLGEYCRALKGLEVRDCRDVTEISLARLRANGMKIDKRKKLHITWSHILHSTYII